MPMKTMRLGWLILALSLAGSGCQILPGMNRHMTAGQDGGGPWWMRETALTTDGKFDLKAKSWWPRACRLKAGESFLIDVPGSDSPAMLVRRETFKKGNREIEAIVWIIDDDRDGSVLKGGDRDSDCYVADYGPDGVVDRMVDYIDNDNDNDPDEMDIRYFVNGALNYCWFGMDLDDDNLMWSLVGYEYGGPSFFEGDPYGNGMIFMNKFNPNKGSWSPISECPFAFYDTDGDGQSEVVVRVSAVPIKYDKDRFPDYANTQYGEPWSPEMDQMGIVNIRYSFDIDNLSSKETPLHYDFGFNLVGSALYDYAGMRYFNPKRRPPQTVCVVPYNRMLDVSNTFHAKETGFSWHENVDDTIAIGYGKWQKDDWRWEGVFWIWERRFMENTGGPCQKWNVRREWSDHPADRRELYYSEIDHRIHLFGAHEGWIQVGHFAGLNELGEIRMFDTDDNGYFDRWEVYWGNDPTPARVTQVRDEKARRIPFDEKWLSEFYTRDVLPKVAVENDKLMAAMSSVQPFTVPEPLLKAMGTGSPGYRRYAQDIACEMQYQALRKQWIEKSRMVLGSAKKDDLRGMAETVQKTTWNSRTAWKVTQAIEKLDVTFGQRNVEGAQAALAELSNIEKAVKE